VFAFKRILCRYAPGNLLLFDSRINKTMSILGKHTKMITCGAWSPECRLALGGAVQAE
jgi:hypothetical protein